MSPLNNFAAQLAGRRNVQPQSPQSDPNQNWNGQGQAYQSQQQHAQPQNGGYGQQPNFGQPSFTPAFQPMQDQAPQTMPAQNTYASAHDPYAQHRTAAQQTQPQYQPSQGYGQQQTQQQAQQQSWQQPDPRGFDVGSYMTPAQAAAAQAATQYRNSPFQQQAEFDQGYANQGQGHGDWNQGQGQGHGYQGQDMGFAQAAGGELDPNYGDEQHDYDGDDAPRGRRPLMIAAALAGAIFVGGGLAYSYKSLIGGSSGGNPPVVKSAEGPSKAKPADAGGKQFAHTDSKIMGRLGDGNSGSASSETDPNGTRKVSTLVVGRDGTIQSPPIAEAQPAPAAAAPVTGNGAPEVPGMMVVDAFSNNKPSSAAAAIAAAAPGAPSAPQVKAPQKLTVTPPAAPAAQAQAPVAPVKIAKAETPKPAIPAPAQTGSVEPAAADPVAPATPAAVAPAPVKKPKVAAAQPAAPAAVGAPAAAKSNSVATTGSGSNGFVAVLASVPRSDSSRMDALKRFADMQVKYGAVLAGKTPDVAEANLGAKGAYHRLVVGPPGSRDQASSVCSQLKSQGYGDCWVTSY